MGTGSLDNLGAYGQVTTLAKKFGGMADYIGAVYGRGYDKGLADGFESGFDQGRSVGFAQGLEVAGGVVACGIAIASVSYLLWDRFHNKKRVKLVPKSETDEQSIAESEGYRGAP